MTPSPLILNILTLGFLTSLILLPTTSLAISFKSGTDFNAHYQSYNTDWRYTNNSTQDTRISRLGIGWKEKISEYIHGGLKAGYLDITQANNPISTARITEGQYFGITIGSTIIDLEWFNLSSGLSYSYNSTERQETSQSIELRWNQTVLDIQSSFHLIPRLSLTLGGKLTWIEGEERATGTITQVRSFEQNKIEGYYARIDLATDRTGSIGVSWEGGTQDGVSIYFRRQF